MLLPLQHLKSISISAFSDQTRPVSNESLMGKSGLLIKLFFYFEQLFVGDFFWESIVGIVKAIY